MQNRYPSKSHFFSSKRNLALAVVAGVVLLFLILEATNAINVFHKSQPVTASGEAFNSKGEPQNAPESQSNNSPTNNQTPSTPPSQTSKSTNNTGVSSTLITPSGDFVSNHSPNLDGSPAPNLESSVCTTTPGATCQITFTNGSVTKQLETRTADSNGSVFWDWKLQDIGLTQGSWQIKAIAQLNGSTKTATDAISLEVGP